jgi:DNA replication protein DnaC
MVLMGECGTGKTHLATRAWPRAGRKKMDDGMDFT